MLITGIFPNFEYMEERKLPSPEQLNYGKEKYEEGYARGYEVRMRDLNKQKSKRQEQLYRRFCKYVDYLDDLFADNRKR